MGNGVVEKFIEIMNSQAALYNALTGAMKKEAAAIVEKDVKTIEAVAAEEDEAVNKIKALEKEKKVLFEKLAEEKGLANKTGVTLMDVLAKTAGSDRTAAEKALAGLLSAIKAVDAANAANAHLLKNFIEFAGFSKTLRQKINDPEFTTYEKSGDKKEGKIADGPKIDKTV